MPAFRVSQREIDAAALSEAMQNPAAGAFASFEGRVRNHNEGHPVLSLDYEVFHALALEEGNRILTEAIEKYALIDASAVHREGHLKIGDTAVWVGVLSAHRAEAFAACRYIIDTIKHRLPVWKKEFYANGTAAWVNCQHEGTPPDRQHDSMPHIHHESRHPAPVAEDYYRRQMALPEIGVKGQALLSAARVLVVGAGGLGCGALPVLATAGIGTIGIVDDDPVEASNLHRQTLYTSADTGQLKAERAALRLSALNPLIDVRAHPAKATADSLPALLDGYDLVLDCTDNFEARYLLNDAAILSGKPLVQASLYRFEGQLLTIAPHHRGGCLRCLWPEPPAAGLIGDCTETGVLGSVPLMFGTLQASQAIKYLLGTGVDGTDHLFTFDLLSMTSHTLARQRRPDCALCGDHPVIRELMAPAGDDVFLLSPVPASDDLLTCYRWIDVREAHEREARPLPGADHYPFSQFDIPLFPYPPDTALLVICATGQRSGTVVRKLRQAGYRETYSLRGGLRGWTSSPVSRAG